MSLINEALKKAQKQQLDAAAKDQGSTPTPPPPPKAPPQAPASASPEPEGDPIFAARRQRGRNGAGKWTVVALAIAVVGGVGFFLTSSESTPLTEVAEPEVVMSTRDNLESPAPVVELSAPEETAAEVVVAEVPAQRAEMTPSGESASQEVVVALPVALTVTPVPETSESRTSLPKTAEPQMVNASPAAPKSSPVVMASEQSNQDVAVANQSTPRSEPAPATAAPTVSAATTPARGAETPGKVVIETVKASSASTITPPSESAPPANDAVLNYLERARVTGIRVSTTDPKVLMNNRVYRLNEVVDRDLQLRVVHIAPRELRFEDPRGHVYRKTF